MTFELRMCSRLSILLKSEWYIIKLLRYHYAQQVAHTPHVESSIGRNGEAQSPVETTLCCAFAYPIHRSASKVSRLGTDVQVVSSHRYLVVFHPFVEQLTIFHISGLVPASSSIHESSTSSQPHEQHMPKRYVNYA